jgi:hypothetical protein
MSLRVQTIIHMDVAREQRQRRGLREHGCGISGNVTRRGAQAP